MNIGHTKQGRPDYYDRTPISHVFSEYIDGLAAPAHWVQWTYTVPSNRKAYLQSAHAELVRQTADAVLSSKRIEVDVERTNFDLAQILSVHVFDNTIGAHDGAEFAGAGLLNVGEQIFGQIDLNGNGVFFETSSAWLVEFDE